MVVGFPKRVGAMFLLSSTSAAIKVIEFLLDKTLWKYFDKTNANHTVESMGNSRSKILLLSNVSLKEDISLGIFKHIFIKKLRFIIHSIQNIEVSIDNVELHIKDFKSSAPDEPSSKESDSSNNESFFRKNSLSSSFHFAGDFIRNELDSFDGADKDILPGLSDLAKIIDTLIGKAKLLINNITVKIFTPHTGYYLCLSIKELKLKDHVVEDFDIPSELLSQEVDVLSFIVKYLVASDFIASFHLEDGKDLPLLKISVIWIRVIFSQNDDPLLASGAASPTLSNHSSSALFSDFQLKTFAYGMLSIVRIKDIKRINSLFQQVPDSPAAEVTRLIISNLSDDLLHSSFNKDLHASDIKDEASTSNSPLQFSFFCNSASFCIIPSNAPVPSLEMYASFVNRSIQAEFWEYPHLLLLTEKIKFHKSSDGKLLTFAAKKLEIKEFDSSNRDYVCIISAIKPGEFNSSIEAAHLNFNEGNDDDFILQIDYIPSSILAPSSLSVHLSSILLNIKLNRFKNWKSYFESESTIPHSAPEKSLRIAEVRRYVEIHITRVLVMADFSTENENALTGVFLDISNLHLQSELNNSWNIEMPFLSIGLFPITPKNRSVTNLKLSHTFIFSKIIIGVQGNEFNSDNGLSDEFVNLRHEMVRECVSVDTHSTKSWSDMDNESDTENCFSPKPEPPASQPTKIDLIDPILLKAKFIITLNCLKCDVKLNDEELSDLRWVIDTIQSLNANNPPEPTQFPITIITSINFCGICLQTNQATASEEYLLNICIDEVDFIVGLASFQSTKNIVLFDLFCDGISYESTLKSNHQWKLIKRLSDKEAMLHILFSQCEDLDIEVRQMKLTSCLNNASFHLPDIWEDLHFPVLSPPSKQDSLQPESPVSTFLDLFVVFSNCNIMHSLMEKNAVLKADSLKIVSNLITSSPTKGFAFSLFNAELAVGINPLIRDAFHKNLEEYENFYEKISLLKCVPVLLLDSLKLDIRTNPAGVLPLFDYTLGFNQITIETCSDSRIAALEYLSSLFPSKGEDESLKEPTESSTVPSKMVDTFESIDDTAFETKSTTSHVSAFEVELEELEDEQEWHMDFETTYTKEEEIRDRISIFPHATQFVLKSDYISQIVSAPVDTIETTNTRFSIVEGNISWRLYPGFDYADDGSNESRQSFQIEVHLLKINLAIEIFPEDVEYAKSIRLKIRDVEVFDRVPKSKFRKFFCYQTPDGNRPPRETESDMIDIFYETVRMEKEELRLKVKILPIELHIDQDVISFLEKFFDGSFSESEPTEVSKNQATKSLDTSFFQYAEIFPISIQIDYKPKHVNYSSIKQGELMQLINFIHLDEAKVYLNGIKVAGIHGWHKLFNKLISIWLPHIKNTQIPYMASGIAGIKTISNLSSGIADLVLLPIEQYQKDGKILKGISKGTRSFLKATTTETVRIGSHLASGAQIMLEKAERKSKVLEQSPQAVPANLLKPLIRFTGSVADTLAKLSDSLNGNHISSKKLGYLSDEFDPRKTTISQLCSILSKHNVDLPTSKQRKDVYVELFIEEIHLKRKDILAQMKNVKPSSKGIEIVDDLENSKVANSMIPVLKLSGSKGTPQRKEALNEITNGSDKDIIAIVDDSTSPKKKPSLLTAIKPVQSVKRKSLDSEKISEIRADLLLSDDEDIVELPEKRLKVADNLNVDGKVDDINDNSWTPRLAWKLGKPPTPMQMKSKSKTTEERSSGNEEQIEAPKQKRFNIQPQLPGVRQNLPHFSPQKSIEHLKPVKELIAKFDDGVPVIPGVAFQLNKQDEHDSDSTLSAPDEYEDSFLIEQEEIIDLKKAVLLNEESSDSVLKDEYFEEKEPEMIPYQNNSLISTLFWLFKSMFTLSILLLFAMLLTWCINEIAATSSSFSTIATKIQANLIFSYRNPEVVLDSIYFWILKQRKLIDRDFIYANLMKMQDYLQDYLSKKASSLSELDFKAYITGTAAYMKSFFVDDAFSHPILMIQMTLHQVRELCLDYTEKITDSLTQYSLIAKYEISKMILWARNHEVIMAILLVGEQAMQTLAQVCDVIVRFLASNVKKITSEENWKLLIDFVREYPAPFGLDNQSFIALLVGSGLTFGAIGAFLLLI